MTRRSFETRRWTAITGMKRSAVAVCAGLLVWSVIGSWSTGALWAEVASERNKVTDLEGARLVLARCAVCHSTDLIVQQRLSGDRWIAEVEKMVHWGGQLNTEEQKVVVAYLSKHFHPEARSMEQLPGLEQTGSSVELKAFPVHTGVATKGRELYRQNCVPCHGQKAEGGVGPRLVRSPILSEDERFWTTVTQGRGGMPPWGSVLKPQEIADIQAWLRALRE